MSPTETTPTTKMPVPATTAEIAASVLGGSSNRLASDEMFSPIPR